MKFDYLKEKTQLLSRTLLAAAAFLAIVILITLTGIPIASAYTGKMVRQAVAYSKTDPNEVEKALAKSKAKAEEIKKKNLFAPAPPKKHPVKQVQGILGKEVLVKGKWYKVGDKVGDAKIQAIEPTHVKIEWDGKEKVFAPLAAVSTPTSRKQVKNDKPPENNNNNKKQNKRKRPTKVKPGNTSAEEDPLAWMGVKLSPALREKLMEQWNKMSDEQKQQWKEQWNSMSQEQKQKAIEQMEQSV